LKRLEKGKLSRYNRLENREKLIDNICPPIGQAMGGVFVE
jgi:hypothetical protein